MTETERDDTLKTTTTDLAGMAFDQMGEGAGHNMDLNQESIARAEAWYKSYGQLFPQDQRLAALANVSSYKNAKIAATTLGDGLTAISSYYGVKKDWQDEKHREAALEATQALAKIVVSFVPNVSPEVTLWLSVIELDVDAGYGALAVYLATSRAVQMYDVQTTNLQAITSLSTAYVRLTDKINALKSAREALTAWKC